MFKRILGKSLRSARTAKLGVAFLSAGLLYYQTQSRCRMSVAERPPFLSPQQVYESARDSIVLLVNGRGEQIGAGVGFNGYVVAYFAQGEHIERLQNRSLEVSGLLLSQAKQNIPVPLKVIAVKEDENLVLLAPFQAYQGWSFAPIAEDLKVGGKLLMVALSKENELDLRENFICQLDKIVNFVDFPTVRLSKVNRQLDTFQMAFDSAGLFAGFTIPDSALMISREHILALTDSFRASQKFERAYLGISMKVSDPDHLHRGMLVTNIHTSSPAAKAGLQMGDIIMEVNGHPTTSASELYRVLGYKRGRALSMKVKSDGVLKTINLNV